MAKRKSRDKSGPVAAGRRRSLPNWPLLGLAGAGMLLTAYLALSSWLGTAPAFCTEGSACDVVQRSRWGTFLFLPTAAWGFLAYATLGHIAWRVRDAGRHWRFSSAIALVGVAISAYLTFISVRVIGATCLYCLASLGLMAAILAVTLLQRPELGAFSWPSWAGQTGLLAAAVVLALHLHYSGVFDSSMGPEDPYLRGLAEHLASSGAVFYGAYW
jgi:uncharacterized membrane protein